MKKNSLAEEERKRRTILAEHMLIWLYGFFIAGLILLIIGSILYVKSYSLLFLLIMMLPGILIVVMAIITMFYAKYLIKNKKKNIDKT